MFQCEAQNLVVNPSFERPDSCGGYAGMVGLSNWSENAHGSPDSYKICADVEAGFGFQLPYDGNAFIGECMFAPNEETHEVARGELVFPLEIGIAYYVSFKVSLANSVHSGINKIGALFTTAIYPVNITNYAHIYTDSIITDTLNWTTISGCFTADSNYKYICLGNFFDNAHIEFSQAGVGYYYIDYVQVYADSSCDTPSIDTTTIPPIDTVHTDTIPPIDTTHIDTSITSSIDTFTMPSAFTPNGDNVNDLFQPVPASTNVLAFRIYNRWGEKMYEASGTNTGWDGKYKGEPQPTDVYAYYIEVKLSNGKTESKMGSFTLLR